MDVQEAFKILNLSMNATKEGVNERYKELAKENHPDKGGNNKHMRDVTEARDVASAFCDKNQLVPIEVAKDLMLQNTKALIQSQNRVREVERTKNQITRRYASRYKTYKRTTGFAGIAVGGLALISNSNIFNEIILPSEFSPMFFLMTFIMGLYYWMFSTMAENIKNAIEDAADELDDKEIFARTINKIIPDHREGFTKEQLINSIASWLGVSRLEGRFSDVLFAPIFSSSLSLNRLARKIGPRDFSKILISKGLEKGMLEEKEIINGGGDFILMYVPQYITK